MRTMKASYKLFKDIFCDLLTSVDYSIWGFLPPTCMTYTTVNSHANYKYCRFLQNVQEVLYPTKNKTTIAPDYV